MRKHITVEGASFDALALHYYGDEQLASKIIQANPDHCDTLIFEAGIALNIPDKSEVAPPETLPPWRRGE
jgi:phage tail protein X